MASSVLVALGNKPITDWNAQYPGLESTKVSSAEYYAQYHGHPLNMLRTVISRARFMNRKVIWLMGDSSLDNKHWLFPDSSYQNKVYEKFTDDTYTADAINGYEDIFDNSRCIKDVCYWINAHLMKHPNWNDYICINASVEESTLADRDNGLLPHDQLVRDFLMPGDIIIASVGGNDIALRPTTSTMVSLATLNWLLPQHLIDSDYIVGDGALDTILRVKYELYLSNVTERFRFVSDSSLLIVPCMVYFPSINGSGWCDPVLYRLGYDNNPQKLQAIMRMAFRRYTSNIKCHDVPICPIALYEILDGTNDEDYNNRVEPSVQGSQKLANFILTKITNFRC